MSTTHKLIFTTEDERQLLVKFRWDGNYRLPTLYQPEEFPELDIISVTNIDDNKELWDSLDEYTQEQIEDACYDYEKDEETE